MRGVELNQIPVKSLRKTIFTINGERTSTWPKKKCVEWLAKKKIDKMDIGTFCRFLLRITVKKTLSGFSIGLNYSEIVDTVHTHFPHCFVNKTHLSWYATTMRSKGEMIPVYRQKKGASV